MTYASLTSQTKGSELPDLLNGVTTRAADMRLEVGSGGSWGSQPGGLIVPSVALDAGEDLAVYLPVPPRVDSGLGATVSIYAAPTASQASRVVRWTLGLEFVDAAAAVALGTPFTESVTSSDDVDVSATANQTFVSTLAFTSAIWSGKTAGYLVGLLSRATPSGTDAGTLGVLGVSLTYSINR